MRADWLGNIMEESRQTKHQVGGYFFKHTKREFPYITSMYLTLFKPYKRHQLRHNIRHGTAETQQLHRPRRVGPDKHLVEFLTHTLRPDYPQPLRIAAHGLESRRFYLPAIAGGKTDCAENAHRVVIESGVGSIGRAYHAVVDIIDATAENIEQTPAAYVIVKGVDGKVAAPAVGLYRPENNSRVSAPCRTMET